MNSLSWQLSCFLQTVPPSPLRVPVPAHLAALSRWFWPGTTTPVPRGSAQLRGEGRGWSPPPAPLLASNPTPCSRAQNGGSKRSTSVLCCVCCACCAGYSLQPHERPHRALGPISGQHRPMGLEGLRARLPQRRRGCKPRSRGNRSSGRRVRSARCRHRHGPQAGQGRRGGRRRRRFLRGDRSEELGGWAGVRPAGGGEGEGRPRGAWRCRGEGRSAGAAGRAGLPASTSGSGPRYGHGPAARSPIPGSGAKFRLGVNFL